MKPYIVFATLIALAACSSPSGPKAPTSVELDIRVMGVNESPIDNVDIWLLDEEHEIIEQLVSSTSGVRINVETKKRLNLLVYDSGFRLVSSSFTMSRDSTINLTLQPVADSISVNVTARSTFGFTSPIDHLQAFLSVGSIRLETVHPGYFRNKIDLPNIADNVDVHITASDCDTLVMALSELVGLTTPLTLTKSSIAEPDEPQITQTVQIGSAWSDYRVGLQGVTVVVQGDHQTVFTDANGVAALSFNESEPKSIEIHSDAHESLSLTLPVGTSSYWIYLNPKTESLVPLFELAVNDTWLFNLVNTSRSMGLTTESTSSIQWKLVSMNMEVDGSHLLTFHSTGSGVTTHPMMPPVEFTVDDTIRIRESAAGYWTKVSAHSRYPMSFEGYAATELFPVNPENFTMTITLDNLSTIPSIRKPFRRLVPAGILDLDAGQYGLNQTGLRRLWFSQSGGNTGTGATLTRIASTSIPR
jgi:hypothetical protein